MLEADLHVHTLFSNCGIHTYIEMLTRARQLGIKAVAITDHGPAIGGRVTRPAFERLHDPVDGVRLLKGMECNVLAENGNIDLPAAIMQYLDIVLLGLHHNLPPGLSKAACTDLMLAAMEHNPCVDIITHANDAVYPVDFDAVAALARERGMAVEINNSKTRLGRTTPEAVRSLVDACRRARCLVAVTSDAHAIGELGDDSAVKPYLEEAAYPPELVLTRDAESAFAFIERRRENKR
ncbi:MAG: PHP domain-containing protein [Chitinivibrionales bacterium]|nr:PHP domain-containing protein [Chitinivibrionales bacterium]MBD3394943.1 PHP domain-containing protein [Chitinivibrionales bacterium]